MTAKKWTLTAISALILTACSGGDDSSGSTDNAGISKGDAQQITLNTVTSNYCGIKAPKSGVSVFVHNNAGDIIAEHVTDSAGSLTADWPSNAKHITLTADTQVFYKSQPTLKVISSVDVEAGDLGITYFRDDNNEEGCNCKQVELTLQTLITDSPDSMLYLGSSRFELTPFTNNPVIKWCHGAGPIDVQLVAADRQSSLAGSINLADTTQYTLDLSDFPHQGVAVDYINPYDARNLYALSFDGWTNYSQDDPVFVYPTLTNNSYVWPAKTEHQGFANTTAFSYSSARHKVTAEGSTSPIMLWEPANGFSDDVYSLFNEIVAGTPPYQYDFSGVGNVALTHMSLMGDTNDGNAEWIIWGGASGSMPELKLPTALDEIFDSLSSPKLEIGIRGYGAEKPLNEWRKLLAERTRMAESGTSVLNYETNYMSLTFDL